MFAYYPDLFLLNFIFLFVLQQSSGADSTLFEDKIVRNAKFECLYRQDRSRKCKEIYLGIYFADFSYLRFP